VVFASAELLPAMPAVIIGGAVTAAVTLYNFKALRQAAGSEGFEFLNKRIRKFIG
jgi:hypothetical protein